MVQGYLTLQEAADVLGVSADDLRRMAQKNEIRSFQDRGTLRFRIQDVQELARTRGVGSDADAAVSQAPPPPKSGITPRTPKAQPTSPEVFEFALGAGDEKVDIGQEAVSGGRKSGLKKGGPASPQPTPGSDSDVRLVADGSDLNISLGSDSDVKLVGSAPSTPKSESVLGGRSGKVGKKSALGGPHSPKPATPPVLRKDSQLQLPLDSDSDVKIVGAGSDEVPLGLQPPLSATDSDVRLEQATTRPPSSGEGMLTEEINLDEELKKQEAKQPKQPVKVKPKSRISQPSPPPVESPFELSDSDLDEPSSSETVAAESRPDSSDIDLVPVGDGAESLLGDDSSEDFSLELPDESGGQDLVIPEGEEDLSLMIDDDNQLKAPSSGISLSNPVDAGISLEEKEESEVDFEISLDAQATPKPKTAGVADDSDSQFELSLDVAESPAGEAPPEGDSSSEFELTLDDDSSIIVDDRPQVKADSDEQDIFETDDVPALDDESGSQVAAVETDLDSSDFDLALGDNDIAVEDESGSQVVALDEEEEADDAAATVAGTDDIVVEEGSEFGELSEEEAGVESEEEPAAEGAEGEVREVVREKVVMAHAAPWGVLPVILMLPCVILMFLVGLMGFELIQSVTGYKPAGFLTKTFSELVGLKIK